MTIKEMHYDFKQKLNKIDSQQNRNLRVPEIDWKLNEAIELFIKIVAQPKTRNSFGFETSQRIREDLRTLVVDDFNVSLSVLSDDFLVAIPDEYLYFVKISDVIMSRGKCSHKAEKIYVRQHDDDFTYSPFDKSSFEWRELNVTFSELGIRLHSNGNFNIDSAKLSYIKKPAVVHNAEDFPGGSYEDLSGNNLTGTVDCDLPPHTHREIVDLAVAITTGDLIPDYQSKLAKLRLNQIS